MIVPWSPVVAVDIIGSAMMLLLSTWCAVLATKHARDKPDDVFRNYIFLFTLAIVLFSISRSFGHLVKQLLLLNNMGGTWALISPYSGAVNSATFIIVFAFCIYFHRFQRVHVEIEYYKNNLEALIQVRTEQLEKSKNTLENILNNSNPINITSVDFDLLQANEAYYSIWPKTMSGKEFEKCYESRPGDHCHTDDCPLKLIIEGHKEVVQEVTKDIRGDQFDFLITARPFRDVDGRLIGMVESFVDITLRKKAERALLEMDRIKSEFISTAAHELNTPLSSLMGYIEFLRNPEEYGGFTEVQRRDFLDEAYDRGEALSLIISDLLDISRIESGRPLPLDLHEIDLPEVLRRKARLFLTGLSGCKINLVLPDNPASPIIVADHHRINQVLDNLLNNAIKYSPKGEVVTLRGVEVDSGWEVSVEDRGVGMNEDQLERVFEKFYRADSSNTAVAGLGLGMSIARYLVEAHGGNIVVESSEGKGTKVTFTLLFKPECRL